MQKIKAITEAHEQGFNCAASILGVYGPEFQIERNTALRLAGSLGGGLARQGETCGAVTGALLVIGLHMGATDPADQAVKDACYQAGERFMEEFCRRNGTVLCRELLGCDISSAEGLQFARDQQLFAKFCGEYVHSAAEILEEMLASPSAAA